MAKYIVCNLAAAMGGRLVCYNEVSKIGVHELSLWANEPGLHSVRTSTRKRLVAAANSCGCDCDLIFEQNNSRGYFIG